MLSGDGLKQYLVFVILGGHRTERLKGHIIPKRITANDANEAVEKAVEGKIFEEEGFEIVAIENVGIRNWPKNMEITSPIITSMS